MLARLVCHQDAQDQRQWVRHPAVICNPPSNALPERLESADGLMGLWTSADQVDADEEYESRGDRVAEVVASVAKELNAVVCDQLTSADIHLQVELIVRLLSQEI